MPAAKVTRVRMHRAQCDQLLRTPGGAVYDTVDKYQRRVTALAKAGAPKDSGVGAASIAGFTTRRGMRVVATIGTPLRYMLWQHEGTGVYAGRGRITPKRAQALAFQPKGQRASSGGPGRMVIVKSVKGVKGKPYLTTALHKGCPWPAKESNDS